MFVLLLCFSVSCFSLPRADYATRSVSENIPYCDNPQIRCGYPQGGWSGRMAAIRRKKAQRNAKVLALTVDY